MAVDSAGGGGKRRRLGCTLDHCERLRQHPVKTARSHDAEDDIVIVRCLVPVALRHCRDAPFVEVGDCGDVVQSGVTMSTMPWTS